MLRKKKIGQYFTTNNNLKQTISKLILNEPAIILEPSIGRGDLVSYISKKRPKTIFHSYELDHEIELLNSIIKEEVNYTDFLGDDISIKYETIIGNPPYVKKEKGNLYIDFIEKCYSLLENNGELIFIVPSNFTKLTSASKLINVMLETGNFTHFIYPNKENLFLNASIDVMVFRYCKTLKLSNETFVNGQKCFLVNNNGIITFSETSPKYVKTFNEYFNIFVGQVTGCEAVFKNKYLGNIKVLNKENEEDNYILIKEFPTPNKKLNEYLLKQKKKLLARKIKKFTETNWFTWGALRNYEKVKLNFGRDCIYVYSTTRKKKVAFIDKVKFFGGNLILLLPKKSVNLEKTVKYLNSDDFKKNHTYAGRFKIGQKVLLNSLMNVPSNLF